MNRGPTTVPGSFTYFKLLSNYWMAHTWKLFFTFPPEYPNSSKIHYELENLSCFIFQGILLPHVPTIELCSGKMWHFSAGKRQGDRRKKAKGRNETCWQAFPMGKNVTFENRCLPCVLGLSGTYLLRRITVGAGVAGQAIPSPPLAVITTPRREQTESEIIQNLNSECSNQNVSGLEAWMNNLAP